MKLSIRYKLLLSFSFVLLLSFLVFTIGYGIIVDTIKAQTPALQIEKAEQARAEVQNFITDTETDLLGISESFREDISPDRGFLRNTIIRTIRLSRFFESISILTIQGREIVKVDRYGETPESELSYEIPTSTFYDAVNGKSGITKVYFAEDDNIPRMDIFYPILTGNGEVLGVIKGNLQLENLWDIISQVKSGETGFAYLVDEEGRLIAHPDIDFLLEDPILADRNIVRSLLNNNPSNTKQDFIYTNEENIEVISNGLSIPGLNWAVIIEQPLAEAYREIYLLNKLFYAAIISSFLLLTMISLLISENITRPVRLLQKHTEKIKQGDLDEKINITSNDEIEDLGSSFNLMTARLKESIEDLKSKIVQLQEQKDRLDQSAKLLLRRDLDLRKVYEDLQVQTDNITAETNKLKVIITGIEDGVIAVDFDRKIQLFNKSAEEITGYKAEDVTGRYIGDFINVFTDGKELKPEDYCVDKTKLKDIVMLENKEITILGKNNKKTYVSLTIGHLDEKKTVNIGIILTMHDITKEYELEKMKLDFVSMAAHELRTPITTIRGYLSVFIDENSRSMGKDQMTFLRRIDTASSQLSALVEDLLNVSRIDRGTFMLEIEETDWISIVEESINEIKEQADNKKISIKFTKPKAENIEVSVDRLRIKEVLTNLLTNAINYTRTSGKIEVAVENKKNSVVTNVKDTGIGIPKHAISRLFKKFYRVSGDLEEETKGTGLGLYIAKSIVSMHYGKIWVKSKEGKGSVFSFSLPKKRKKT